MILYGRKASYFKAKHKTSIRVTFKVFFFETIVCLSANVSVNSPSPCPFRRLSLRPSPVISGQSRCSISYLRTYTDHVLALTLDLR